MSEFFAMGGYAGYIWPAYAIPTILMLVIWLVSQKNLADSWRTLATLEADLAKHHAARDNLQPGDQSEGQA